MTSLFRKAKKAHNQLQTKNFVFKELKWYKNPTYIHHTIVFLTAIPMLVSLKSNSITYIFLVWGISISVFQFTLFRYIDKLICAKYNFKFEKKGLFWKFPYNKLNKTNNKLFYKKLITTNELQNNKGDIKLLTKLEKEIKKRIKPISSYILQAYFKKAFPIIISIFVAFVAVILDKSKDIISDSKLVLIYSLILFVAVFIVLYFDKIILDILNIKYRRQQVFFKRVSKLKEYLKSKH